MPPYNKMKEVNIMPEQKKVDIFSLYEREKRITLSDNEKSIDVIFVKMTQAELSEAIDIYNKSLRKERENVKNDKYLYEEIKNLLESFNKEDLVTGVLSVEKVYREQYADLYPIEDEENKSKEERDKILFDELSKWELGRKEELLKEEKNQLVDRLVNLRIESIATIRASSIMNQYSLSIMVRDAETRERVFKTPEDVLRVKDKSILDKLTDTLNDFNKNINDKKTREITQSENFTQAGQSQEK